MAGTTGLEPATSAVTGQRSNQLSYVPSYNLDYLTPQPAKKRQQAPWAFYQPLAHLLNHSRAQADKSPTGCNELSECTRNMGSSKRCKDGSLSTFRVQEMPGWHNSPRLLRSRRTTLARPSDSLARRMCSPCPRRFHAHTATAGWQW
jgi:hypothetical protein